jgi:hypothetical protein
MKTHYWDVLSLLQKSEVALNTVKTRCSSYNHQFSFTADTKHYSGKFWTGDSNRKYCRESCLLHKTESHILSQSETTSILVVSGHRFVKTPFGFCPMKSPTGVGQYWSIEVLSGCTTHKLVDIHKIKRRSTSSMHQTISLLLIVQDVPDILTDARSLP